LTPAKVISLFFSASKKPLAMTTCTPGFSSFDLTRGLGKTGIQKHCIDLHLVTTIEFDRLFAVGGYQDMVTVARKEPFQQAKRFSAFDSDASLSVASRPKTFLRFFGFTVVCHVYH